MFTYWGRRGALSKLALEVARTALADQRLSPIVSVSRQNENFAAFAEMGPALFPIDTFSNNAGLLTQAWRIPLIRSRLSEIVRRDNISAVIELMPHVWSPLIMPAVRRAGALYCTVIHDADAHPGDRTGWAKPLLDLPMRSADVIVTLSAVVAARIVAGGRVPPDKVRTLFLPDFNYGSRREREPPPAGGPMRLLFLGRIMPYKGLPLFLDAVELLRAEGLNVHAGVFGEGQLGVSAEQLQRLNAEVVNRWLAEDEIATVLQRYDAVVLSHLEASQSGVAAAAYGAGLPIVATPVGGLTEQVIDGVTGMIAARVDAAALADAAKRLLLDPERYRDCCANIRRSSEGRSMRRFVDDIVDLACTPRTGSGA